MFSPNFANRSIRQQSLAETDHLTIPTTMCLLCVSKSGGARGVRQLLSSWQGSAVSQAAQACEHAPKAAGQRLFSSGQPALPNVKDGKVAHPDLLNENLLKAQYAVRGELYNKAMELQKTGRELIFTNGGRRSPLAACRMFSAARVAGSRALLRLQALAEQLCSRSWVSVCSGQPAAAGPEAHHVQPAGALTAAPVGLSLLACWAVSA